MKEHRSLDHLHHADLKKRWRHILEQAEQVSRSHRTVMTPFLTPAEWIHAETFLDTCQDLQWILQGGYPEAERRRLIMMPDYQNPADMDEILAILRVRHTAKMIALSHRDYLGAVLSKGIDRDVLGDILLDGQDAYLMVLPEMADFLRWNLESVGSVSVAVDQMKQLPEQVTRWEYAIHKGTVSSLRLDAVLSMALHISRGNAQSLINQQKVSLNWQPTIRQTEPVRESDVISVQGYGRYKLISVGGLSRSGRWHIELGRKK